MITKKDETKKITAMRTIAKRAWVNQPSTLQAGHEYHGMNFIVVSEMDTDGEFRAYRAFFLQGAGGESMRAPKEWFSDGWRSDR